VGTVVVLILLALLAAAVVLLPFWRTRQRKAVSLLARYQTISDALLSADLTRAREELKEIIRADTEDVGAYLRLTRIFQREGDYERAVAVRRGLLARNIRDREAKVEIHAGLLEDLLRLKRFEEASRVAEDLRHLDRRSASVARAQIEIALEQEDSEAGLRALDRLRRTDEEEFRREAPRVRTAAAWMRMQQGERKEARKLLEEALKVADGYTPAALLLGDLWCEEGEHERAVQLWTDFVRRRPEAAAGMVNRLERAFFELGRFGDLERFYEDVVAADGGAVAGLRLALARMALRKGRAEQALSIVEDLLSHAPEHAEARAWHLFLLGESGRGAQARQLLRKEIDAATARAEEARCPQCGAANPLPALRCAACAAWMPDPAGGGPAGSPSGVV
jgi:lipopolysaccharide biosynthesis regulator YciM